MCASYPAVGVGRALRATKYHIACTATPLYAHSVQSRIASALRRYQIHVLLPDDHHFAILPFGDLMNLSPPVPCCRPRAIPAHLVYLPHNGRTGGCGTVNRRLLVEFSTEVRRRPRVLELHSIGNKPRVHVRTAAVEYTDAITECPAASLFAYLRDVSGGSWVD